MKRMALATFAEKARTKAERMSTAEDPTTQTRLRYRDVEASERAPGESNQEER
jgi:hypothetical protein